MAPPDSTSNGPTAPVARPAGRPEDTKTSGSFSRGGTPGRLSPRQTGGLVPGGARDEALFSAPHGGSGVERAGEGDQPGPAWWRQGASRDPRDGVSRSGHALGTDHEVSPDGVETELLDRPDRGLRWAGLRIRRRPRRRRPFRQYDTVVRILRGVRGAVRGGGCTERTPAAGDSRTRRTPWGAFDTVATQPTRRSQSFSGLHRWCITAPTTWAPTCANCVRT